MFIPEDSEYGGEIYGCIIKTMYSPMDSMKLYLWNCKEVHKN